MGANEGRIAVLIAESGSTVGGTERVVWELATRLPSSRFDVRVWLPPAPGIDEFATALAARGVTVERVPEVDSRWDWPGMLGTWSRLAARRPEILHIHHVWPAADRYLALLARRRRAARGRSPNTSSAHRIPRRQRSLKRHELGRADAVTAVCGAIAERLVRDYGVRRDRVRVVPNGADLPDDSAEAVPARDWRERFGASLIRPLWVALGRLEEQKGHDVLLAALAEVSRRGLQFTLAIAGDGSRRARLEAEARSLGLGGRVHFLGPVEEPGALLTAADAVLLPSRWEGLPLDLLEALVRGRPTVASAVGGIPEVVESGVHGELVSPGDVAALADALERLHRKPDRALRLGRAGAERVRATYTWTAVVERFESVYDEVLGLATFDPEGVS